MYYCPCPCGDPVDPDVEESSFLALPRNLSYVQDSYLDAHSVSGGFVFNARTERTLAAHTFCPELSNGSNWYIDRVNGEAGECEGEEEDKDHEDGDESFEDERASLLSVVKSQEFSFHTSSASGLDTGTLNLGSTHSRGENNNNNNNNNNSLPQPTASSPPQSSSSSLPLSPPPLLSSLSSSSNRDAQSVQEQPSFIRRVTSFISPKDEKGLHAVRTAHFSSSVDAELTSDLSKSGPPHHSLLKSPDRSGLIMDRGDDLVVSENDEHIRVVCPANSPHGPDGFCDDFGFGKESDSVSDPAGYDPTTTDTSETSKDEEFDVEKKDFPHSPIQMTMAPESPDWDAFSEEGVFVNMVDDMDVHEKTCSEVSDDTTVSVDSMFWSPGETDDVNKPCEKISLVEAINKAAADFNKMTVMMYPDVVGKKTEEDLLPGTSKDFEGRAKARRAMDSPQWEQKTLSIEIANFSGTHTSMTYEDRSDFSPKESPIYEDSEFNFSRRSLRKSSSLKTNKTPPGTPHRKKVVRFADAMGLDLESVRHVLNMESPPKIPASAMADLNEGLSEDRVSVGSRYLSACFSQPGSSDNFVKTVLAKKVRLENAIIHDLTITGFIRVSNTSFHKIVRVRYTHNQWATFHDIAAVYMANSCDGVTDRFSFSIVAPAHFVPGNRLEFAVCYRVEGTEFWDNNDGENYVFECFAKTVPTENETAWLHFL